MPPRFDFNPRERELIRRCSTPERVQRWIDSLKYNWERSGKSTLRSLRRVLRDGRAHCLEGAVAAAALMRQHGYPPLVLCMEARDIDHNLFVFKRDGLWGAVAQSRDPNLRGRMTRYASLRDLVMSYYPYYWNYWTKDQTDLTLRGFSLVNLDRFRQDWVTSDKDLFFIEKYLYEVPYTALFPIPGRRKFVSPKRGKIKWL
jgi:hypothetical protein